MHPFETENEKVYRILQDDILKGKYAPGERLKQRPLAEQLKTSTITVREVFRRLENDGLLAIEPKWGAIVGHITEEKIYGKYIVRAALEGMAARLASKIGDAAAQNQMSSLASECDCELRAERLSMYEKAQLHYRLHEAIARASQCDELVKDLQRLNLYTVILSNAYTVDWRSDQEGWHTLLVEAVISGDLDQAEKRMRDHVWKGYQMVIEVFRKRNGVTESDGAPDLQP